MELSKPSAESAHTAFLSLYDLEGHQYNWSDSNFHHQKAVGSFICKNLMHNRKAQGAANCNLLPLIFSAQNLDRHQPGSQNLVLNL